MKTFLGFDVDKKIYTMQESIDIDNILRYTIKVTDYLGERKIFHKDRTRYLAIGSFFSMLTKKQHKIPVNLR